MHHPYHVYTLFGMPSFRIFNILLSIMIMNNCQVSSEHAGLGIMHWGGGGGGEPLCVYTVTMYAV